MPDTRVRFLSRAQVTELLPTITEQIDLVEDTYRAMARGAVELPPKPGIHTRPDSFIHAMPAYLKEQDVAAMKWVSGYPANPGRGLPYISGVIVVNDPETGVPTAIMDAAEITAARTAAASGVCIREWAPAGWDRAAILGCGEQGRRHAEVLTELNADVVIAAYDVEPSRAESLPGRIEVAADPRTAVDRAAVVVTAGPILEQPDPPIAEDWLVERHLLLPIDFDAYIQVDPIMNSELFVVDDVDQFEYYRTQGHFQGWPAPHATVGEAVGRQRSFGKVVACNLGVGALDAAFAARVLERAEDGDLGTLLEP